MLAAVLGRLSTPDAPALVIVNASPLAVLLGDLATTSGVTRLTLAPLSLAATGSLVGEADARRVFELTGGNPFFINAILASGEAPATVREAALGIVLDTVDIL